MRSLDHAKSRAKLLRNLLDEMGHKLTLSNSLEVISKFYGFRDWNTLSASFGKKSSLLPMPEGWQVSGDRYQDFEYGCAPETTHDGSHPAIIRSITQQPITGFATLMQSVKVGKFAGERVRLRADLRAIQCTGAVTIWLRADGPINGSNLAFDNMESRKGSDGILTGTTGWKTRSIVLDIPAETVSLNYGFYIRGNGTAMVAGFELELVSDAVPITSSSGIPLPEPFNLNFSEGNR